MDPLATAEAAGRYLAEVALLLNGLQSQEQESDDAWCWYFDDGTEVLAEWIDSPGRIVLSTELGEVSAEHAPTVYAVALSFNTLWRDHGSMRIAQGGVSGDLLLVSELATQRADDAARAVASFLSNATTWADYVSAPSATSNLQLSSAQMAQKI